MVMVVDGWCGTRDGDDDVGRSHSLANRLTDRRIEYRLLYSSVHRCTQ